MSYQIYSISYRDNNSNFKLAGYYFYTFFVKISYFLLIVFSIILIAISLNKKNIDLAIRNTTFFITKPITTIAKVPFNLFADFLLSSKNFILTYVENKDLKKENIALRKLYLESLIIKRENTDLKKFVNFINDLEIEFNIITTKLFLSPKNPMENSFILNVGSNNNITDGNIILGKKRSVIGRTINVSKKYSDVLLLTDINSKIPAQTLKTHEKIILSGTNKNYLEINFFNSKEPFFLNDDLVFTMGDSNIIPDGLYIGKIKEVDGKFIVQMDDTINQNSDVLVIVPKANK